MIRWKENYNQLDIGKSVNYTNIFFNCVTVVESQGYNFAISNLPTIITDGTSAYLRQRKPCRG